MVQLKSTQLVTLILQSKALSNWLGQKGLSCQAEAGFKLQYGVQHKRQLMLIRGNHCFQVIIEAHPDA